jgi:serine/threonine protein kinase
VEPGWAITKSNASALNHPNVCTVHDVAEHGNQSFIVMEYVDGRPLDDMIAEAPLAPAVAMDIAAQVAGALAHAHERNIVHGDLKTANVLVSEAGPRLWTSVSLGATAPRKRRPRRSKGR